MTRYRVSIDNNPPYIQTANIRAEILDDARPAHSRSRMALQWSKGLARSGGHWVEQWSEPIKFWWDEFEHEWWL